ncbi:hypothetical protein [Kitasatospora sp. NPDC085879]|uniref:hypothetical protein n=1 Tax=Kitasatospora sp. NPDC085879 TaxID=3154769 RepID=UPI0034488B74
MSETLWAIHRCDADVTVAIDGYTAVPGAASGSRPAMTATLCAVHHASAGPWRRLRTTERASDPAEGHCGWVRDFREPKTLLQAHVDGWLRDLSGVDPANHPDWPAYLTAAHRQLCARYGVDPEDLGRGAIGWIGLAAIELTASGAGHAVALDNAALFLGDAEVLAAMGMIDDTPEHCC